MIERDNNSAQVESRVSLTAENRVPNKASHWALTSDSEVDMQTLEKALLIDYVVKWII